MASPQPDPSRPSPSASPLPQPQKEAQQTSQKGEVAENKTKADGGGSEAAPAEGKVEKDKNRVLPSVIADAQRLREKRRLESGEDKQRRCSLQCERQKKRRDKLTTEQLERARHDNRSRSAAKRATMSEDQLEKLRRDNRERSAARRAGETPVQREHRLAMMRERARQRRGRGDKQPPSAHVIPQVATEPEESSRMPPQQQTMVHTRSPQLTTLATGTQPNHTSGICSVPNLTGPSSSQSLPAGQGGSKPASSSNDVMHALNTLRALSALHLAGLTDSRPQSPVVKENGVNGVQQKKLVEHSGSCSPLESDSPDLVVGAGHPPEMLVHQTRAFSVEAAAPPSTTKPNLESHYNELMRMIAEVGRDVKPAYTNSKASTDRLKKNLMISRGVLRECLSDLDRLYASSESK